MFQACNDRHRLAIVEFLNAELSFAAGDVAAALDQARRVETFYRQRRTDAQLSNVLRNQAAYLLALNRAPEAAAVAREALRMSCERGDAYGDAIAIEHLAHAAAMEARFERSARLMGYADSVYVRDGHARESTEARGYERTMLLLRRALSEERIGELMSRGALLSQADAVKEALSD